MRGDDRRVAAWPARSWPPTRRWCPRRSGEDTVGIARVGEPTSLVKVPVGVKPERAGLRSTPGRLLAAHVGDPADRRPRRGRGRRRQARRRSRRCRSRAAPAGPSTIRVLDAFHVNIADPQIVVVDAGDPVRVRQRFHSARRAHGLDIDVARRRLLLRLRRRDAAGDRCRHRQVVAAEAIAGAPTSCLFNAALSRSTWRSASRASIGCFDTALVRVTRRSRPSAAPHAPVRRRPQHRLTFLPATDRAVVYVDGGPRRPLPPPAVYRDRASRPRSPLARTSTT